MSRKLGWISRDDRHAVDFNAQVRLDDGRDVAARITDLSVEGFRLESIETLPIGARVTVNVNGVGDFEGLVRWSLLGNSGVRLIGLAA
jgi:hypothetical protein